MPVREKETRNQTASSVQLDTPSPDIFSRTAALTQSSSAEDLSEVGPQVLHSAPLMGQVSLIHGRPMQPWERQYCPF